MGDSILGHEILIHALRFGAVIVLGAAALAGVAYLIWRRR